MFKISDVLTSNLVQNFNHAFANTPTPRLDEQLQQSILNTPNTELQKLMTHFFQRQDAFDVLHALDIAIEDIAPLQHNSALKSKYLLETTKIVAFYLALENNIFAQLNIADSLNDYPM